MTPVSAAPTKTTAADLQPGDTFTLPDRYQPTTIATLRPVGYGIHQGAVYRRIHITTTGGATLNVCSWQTIEPARPAAT